MTATKKTAKSTVTARKSAKKTTAKRTHAKKPALKSSASSASKTLPARGALAPERVAAIIKALDETYPDAVCALHHATPWELLVATILSAQCTDARVNMVTPELFRRFPTPAVMAKAPLAEIENLIRTTGFFHNKAKSIQGAAKKISEDFGGKVPSTLAELITIPGAARKTANVVLGVSFGKAEGVVVDTHVFRIARRLELAKGDTPQEVERELMRVLPQDHWIAFSHQIIHHGRQICIARNPKCRQCALETLCRSKDKTWQS
jgi:endonuclease-3